MFTRRTLGRGLWLGLVALVVLGCAITGSFDQSKNKKTRQIEIARLQEIENPESGFKVDLWVDRKDATYKAGEEIVFSFKTNQDCRLTLFNVGTSGEIHILFPNEHHQDNLVKAGSTYRIPAEGAKYLFKAQGPAGEDVVKAIATLEKVALVGEGDVKPAGEFQEVTRPEKDIVIAIQETLKPLDSKRWAEAEKVVKIS